MGVFHSVAAGMSQIFQGSVLLYLSAGTLLGLFFGAVPGLNATLAMVLLLPLTYAMSTMEGFGLLMGAYVGGISGGLVSAVTIGIPGTAASITTTFDGYPMAKKGESGRALGIATVSSFYGGSLGWIALVLLTPQLSRIAMKIGPFEYSAIILFGFTVIVVVSARDISKSMMMAAIGLIIAAVGLDPLQGVSRLTCSIPALDTGFQTVPLLSGVYVVSRALEETENLRETYICPPGKIERLFSQLWKVLRHGTTVLVSSLIGILVGILPGIGASVAPFMAYDQAKRMSGEPESFGTGNPVGIVASEACNNATIGGAMIPALALGIPGDVPVVILLSGLMLHGFQPGPLFFSQHQDMAYFTYAALFVANILMLIIMLSFGIRVFTKIMSVSKLVLIPVILVAGLLGAYNVGYSMTDVWVAFIAGILAYLAIRADYPLTPMVIAVILGPILETNLRVAFTVSNGSFLPFVKQPIALVFLLLTLCVPMVMMRDRVKGRKTEKEKES